MGNLPIKIRDYILEENGVLSTHKISEDKFVEVMKIEGQTLLLNPNYAICPIDKVEPYSDESYTYHSADSSVELYLVKKSDANKDLIKGAIEYLEKNKWTTIQVCRQAQYDYDYLKRLAKKI